MGDILIKNGLIATMNKERIVYPKADMYIDNDKIASIGKVIEVPRDPEFVIDAMHKVVLPGFVNAHAHLQQYFRGVYELIGDFYKVNLPLEGYRRVEDMKWLGPASCAELIYGGCTTSMVIYTYPDGFANSVEKAGNRLVLGADIEEVDLNKLKEGAYEYLPKKGEAAIRRAKELYRKWHGKKGGLFTTVLAPKAADLATPNTYLKCKEFAEEHGLSTTTHLSQSWREFQQVKTLYGKTPPEHLYDLGILNNRLTGAHCTYLTETDTQLIANSGMGILHCRAVTNPLTRWIDLDIPIGLGTDDYFHDMLQLIRQNIAGQKEKAKALGGVEGMLSMSTQTSRPSCYSFLELATRKGAEALGIADKTGSLEPGKKADIMIFDMLNPFLTPTKDPITSIVLYGTPNDIDTVMVDGKILKQDRVLVTLNMQQALVTAQKKTDEIIERFFDDHPDQRRNWERMIARACNINTR